MASDMIRNLVFGFILFSVFSVLVVTAIYEIGFNYGVSDEKMQEATGGALNIDEIETELGNDPTTSENFRQRFESGDVDDVDDASGVFAIMGDLVGLITTPFKLLMTIGKNIGIPTIFIYAILTIINLTLIFGIWSLIRKGD